MTPVTIYKAIRDLLIVAAIAFIACRVYTDGKNSVKAGQLTDLQHQVQEQANKLTQWHGETTDANAALAASLGRINTSPVVVHDWVRSQPACQERSVLPPAAPSAFSNSPVGGSVLPISGELAGDARLRDTAVADFKRVLGRAN
jgi:hypothetical protein